MFRLTCPWCGVRDMIEFTYGGDAGVQRPGEDPETPDEAFFDYVYVRENPRGPHLEYWQHTAGCRQWIRVRRDTLTHEVLACEPASGPMPGGHARE